MSSSDSVLSETNAACFEYIDPTTVTPLQTAIQNAGVQNVWPLRVEKQKLEDRRNELSSKRDEICAELQQQYALRCRR